MPPVPVLGIFFIFVGYFADIFEILPFFSKFLE
jgi:hypothetical protein